METFGSISLREAFGAVLVEAGALYPDLHVLDAGTKNSTMSELFQKSNPDRFLTAGINEPGMIGLATGLAMSGMRVVACDMSIFLQHAYAQIVTAARQGKGVSLIIAASHTGIAVGPDGGSAHDITDLSRMRLVPGFTVLTPWDGRQVRLATLQALALPGLYYIRLNRPKVPIFLPENSKFEINKAYRLREGNAITIIATGDKVYPSMLAADELGVGVAEVIGISTLEPLDRDTIIASVKKTGRVVTVEDHMFIGGLYESVAGVLAEEHPARMRKVAIDRTFTTSGEPDELAVIYKVDKQTIVETCKQFINGSIN